MDIAIAPVDDLENFELLAVVQDEYVYAQDYQRNFTAVVVCIFGFIAHARIKDHLLCICVFANRYQCLFVSWIFVILESTVTCNLNTFKYAQLSNVIIIVIIRNYCIGLRVSYAW